MFKGIRVINNCVIVRMANNDAAREMCGKLLDVILKETVTHTGDSNAQFTQAKTAAPIQNGQTNKRER